jgi:hypothetical protein
MQGTHILYMIMAVLVQIPTVCPAPKPVGTRTGKRTHSATPHTISRCCTTVWSLRYYIITYKKRPLGESGESCKSDYNFLDTCDDNGTVAKLIGNLRVKDYFW